MVGASYTQLSQLKKRLVKKILYPGMIITKSTSEGVDCVKIKMLDLNVVFGVILDPCTVLVENFAAEGNIFQTFYILQYIFIITIFFLY